MQFLVNYRRMESSSSIYNYAESRIVNKIERIDPSAIKLKLQFSVEAKNHIASAQFIGAHGDPVDARCKSLSMYQSIDMLADVLVKQIRKMRSKVSKYGYTKPKKRATREEIGLAV